MIGEPLIEMEAVSKVYVVGAIRAEVLKGLSIRVEPGEYVAVTGASGSGKSTLLNIMGCLDVPTSGSQREAAFIALQMAGFGSAKRHRSRSALMSR